MCRILFTHVPKTSGTSIRHSVFGKNIPDDLQHSFQGMRKAIFGKNEFELLTGHYPYGIHLVYGIKQPRYFLMLREPIDRAISYYYFIKRWSEKPDYLHPYTDEVNSKTILEFYKNTKHQNAQTRFASGLLSSRLGAYMNLNNRVGKWVLNRAQKNLIENYEAFGLKERFDDSAKLFSSRINIDYEEPEMHYMKTPNRPLVQDLSEKEINVLRVYHSLDIELYKFAKDHFDKQLSIRW